MAGRSINIFLPDDSKRDLRVVTIPNWAGSIITASESELASLMQREESQRHGCYIMMSGDRFEGGARVYIGQTYSLKQRLNSADHKDRGWERIAFISTGDTSFSEGHFLYIESRIILDTKNSSSIELQNSNEGRISKGNLGEAQQSDAEAFLENVRFILPVIGFDIFSRKTPTKNTENINDSTPPELELVLMRRKKEHARATFSDGIITVKAGAKTIPSDQFESSGYSDLRESLERQKVISDSGEFLRDYDFKSPSAASAVIFGRNDNGRTSWKLASDTSMSLGDWQNKEAEKRYSQTKI